MDIQLLPAKYRTRSYLAQAYGLCRQTMGKILKTQIGVTHSKRLSGEDLTQLFKKYGTPRDLQRVIELIER